MCLILLAKNFHPDYRIILAANRDEFYNRPTGFLQFHSDLNIYCGTDLKAGGTWMGMNKFGMIAAITNYRNPSEFKDAAESRGHIVKDYLASKRKDYFIKGLRERRNSYNGFNLIFGNVTHLFFYSSKENRLNEIENGMHGLSNADFNTDWPKVNKGKEELEMMIKDKVDKDKIFNLLRDTEVAPDQKLPDTGIGISLERKLSPIFINHKEYGTRASTILTVDYDNNVFIEERSYNNKEENINISKYSFKITNPAI